MQSGRKGRLSGLLEQRVFAVVVDHHAVADPQDAAVVRGECEGMDALLRHGDVSAEDDSHGPPARGLLREVDRIGHTPSVGLRSADRGAVRKTLEIPLGQQSRLRFARFGGPCEAAFLVADRHPVARAAVGMEGPEAQRGVVAEGHRTRVTLRCGGRDRSVERVAQDRRRQRAFGRGPDRVGEDAEFVVVSQ